MNQKLNPYLPMFEKYSFAELKTIYRTLNQAIPKNPELMDSELFYDLQKFLQKAATKANYDISIHADWEDFLRKQT